MKRLNQTLEKLTKLQSHFQRTANRLWFLQTALKIAYSRGDSPAEFLPRRLILLQTEGHLRLEKLLHRLQNLLQVQLDANFLLIKSTEEAETAARIRATLRYIQNAYVTDLPTKQNLERLNRVLPKQA